MKHIFKLIATALLITACSSSTPVESKSNAVYVVAFRADYAPYATLKTYPAQIRDSYESPLSFQVAGKVIKKNVKAGDRVKKDAVLLQIDSKDIDESVNIARAALSQAQNGFDLAESIYERQKLLYADNVTSKTTYEQHLKNYKDASEAVKFAKAQYTQSLNMQEYTFLKAGHDGVIISVDAEKGQVVSPGQPVVTIAGSLEFEAEFYAGENAVNGLATGQKVDLTFWAIPLAASTGIIKEISPTADKFSKTFTVKTTVTTPPPALKAGMTATVNVKKDTDRMIAIPARAVYYGKEGSGVWVIEDEHVRFANIETAGFSGESVWVQNGINEGDIIVSTGVHKLFEGQHVTVYGVVDEQN